MASLPQAPHLAFTSLCRPPHVHLTLPPTSRSPHSAARAVLQAHMLFGGARGDEYLAMFHDSYHAAIRHLKHGSWYIDAHMDSAQAQLLPCCRTTVPYVD